ncbi:glycine zipper 2TM domain-containing protein [Novosphingobium sp. KACC 22771]|uniref:glycine zipper 2TM domain-containing protein n=1 Tax=Novosphingobium sp. KACC 22771 TaxID=3025670 RepID=UPI00236504EA|nr:glycine zipper 2TM domain-containing protein [Novosphingobium sp. KACC 22771]WDF75110.1 glycine zipper 2TM domain-containing protein [Novosphingobium sp. KACC 22771]
MRKLVLSAALAAVMLPIATPALADPPPWAPAYGRRGHDEYREDYRDHGRRMEYRRMSRNDRIWRGNDGRYYCRRSNGTTGLVVGAALGGVLGNQIAGNGDRTLGTILGLAGGGLLGREIDRGNVTCR